MDPDKGNTALDCGRDQAALVTAGRLEGDQPGADPIEPGADRFAIVIDPFARRAAADTQVEPALGNVAPNDGLVRHAPVPPKSRQRLVGTPDCNAGESPFYRSRVRPRRRRVRDGHGRQDQSTIGVPAGVPHLTNADPDNAIHVLNQPLRLQERRGLHCRVPHW